MQMHVGKFYVGAIHKTNETNKICNYNKHFLIEVEV